MSDAKTPTQQRWTALRIAIAVVALVVVVSGGSSTATYFLAKSDAKDQISTSDVKAQARDCQNTVAGRRVLRKVIRQAFAESPPVVLPDDPQVPRPFIDYLQRLVNGMGNSEDRTVARARLLAEAPALRCSANRQAVPVPKEDT